MSNLRGNHSRSTNEYPGRAVYFCSGRDSHVPVAHLDRVIGPTARGGYGLRCPLCGLTKRIGYRARQRIRDAGLTEVDISALPF